MLPIRSATWPGAAPDHRPRRVGYRRDRPDNCWLRSVWRSDGSEILTTYWSPTGWTYPPDGGFAHGPNKKPIHRSLILTPGSKAFIDRFGLGIGTYLSPAGTSYAKRALPPQNLDTYPSTPTYHYNYHLYKIIKPFKVDAGPIAPWFGQKGEGLQYITCFSSDFSHPCKNPNVNDLVQQGDLTEQALPAK